MPVPNDAFDQLCYNVFIANVKTGYDQPTEIPTIHETALGLINQAKVYEPPQTVNLPDSFILNNTTTATTTTTTTNTTNTTTTTTTTANTTTSSPDRRCYRIHHETIQDSIEREKAYQVLLGAIDSVTLLELPFDRNISGYSTKSRTENQQAALDVPVVLDMGLPDDDDEGQQQQQQQHSQKQAEPQTMLLISTPEWIRMTGRVRHWRGESHRIKSVMRENLLNGLLNDRWKPNTSTSTVISSQPPTSGSLVATAIPNTLSTPPPSSPSSSVSSPRNSVIPPSQLPALTTRPSSCKLLFQEQQVEYLAEFMKEFGEELSAVSILRGLLNLIRRQLTNEKVLSWTLDRANLTEQKQEVTVAFLDLFAKLGLELIEPSISNNQVQGENDVTNGITSISSGESVKKEKNQQTELLWTFGSKIDDRRLEFWIRHVQQPYLPVLKTESTTSTSSLPLTNSDSKPHQTQDRKQNPAPLAIRKKFLRDRNTIPAGSIQNLTIPPTDSQMTRDKSLVLASSRFTMPQNDSVASEIFVNRVRKDVIHLAKWASSCGGRLDWFWSWLFSSFHRSRHGSSSSRTAGSGQRPARPNDENV
ncbi:hypothetical protein BGZ76_004044 [Entomortierella beljakovae]|nr:hypothetical protein BGZ76_004044 [Entomortierella beljakovae]